MPNSNRIHRNITFHVYVTMSIAIRNTFVTAPAQAQGGISIEFPKHIAARTRHNAREKDQSSET